MSIQNIEKALISLVNWKKSTVAYQHRQKQNEMQM